MRAHRLWALIASTGAIFLTAGAAALFAPAAAVAAPGTDAAQAYPPPPPGLTVDAGTVTVGDTVEVHGSGFAPFEIISISVRLWHRPKFVPVRFGWGASPDTSESIACNCALRADASGAFTTTIRLKRPGTAIITARGVFSKKMASVAVCVLPRNCSCGDMGSDTNPAGGLVPDWAGGKGSTGGSGAAANNAANNAANHAANASTASAAGSTSSTGTGNTTVVSTPDKSGANTHQSKWTHVKSGIVAKSGTTKQSGAGAPPAAQNNAAQNNAVENDPVAGTNAAPLGDSNDNSSVLGDDTALAAGGTDGGRRATVALGGAGVLLGGGGLVTLALRRRRRNARG